MDVDFRDVDFIERGFNTSYTFEEIFGVPAYAGFLILTMLKCN